MKEVEKPPKEMRQLLPVMLIGLVTLVMYSIFVTFYCLVLLQINVQKQYVDGDLLKEGYTKLLTFHVLLFLFIWSFYKTYTVAPGSIPCELRYCQHEKKYKPDRAHYCRTTKRNILKMDHYCPWVANGVGHHNYKFFLLSIFYANLCCLYVEVNCHSSFPDLYANPNVLFNEVFYIFLEIVLAAVILL